MIRLRHIEIFYAVMIHGSVSGAARMLNLSQPAATRLLQHAEHYWGFSLFERVKNRLIPTLAAQQLFPEVEQAYQQFSVIRHQIAHLRRSSQQCIRLASPFALSPYLMPIVVRHLRKHFPLAVPEIHSMSSRTIINQVLEHKLEIGIIHMAIDHPLINTTYLANNPLYLVYPKSWAFPCGMTGLEKLLFLAKNPMIYFPSEGVAGHVITTWLDSIGVEVSPSVLLHTFPIGLSMVTHGLGWAILDHASVCESKRSFDVIEVVALPEAPCLTVNLIHLRDLAQTSLMECCIEGIQLWVEDHINSIAMWGH